MALDLTFSDEQELLRDTVRNLFEKECPISVVRDLEDDPVGYLPTLWKQMGELDLLGLLLPALHGGSEMTAVEGVVLYEEIGRALVPLPHFVSCVLAAGLVREVGSDDQQATWLPGIASGETVLSVGWLEPDRGFGHVGVATTAEPDGDQWRLDGTKRHVMFASSVERIVVLARTGGDVGAFLVDPHAGGVSLVQQTSVASDTQYRVDLDGATGERLGNADAGDAWGGWERVRDDALILTAAQMVGAADRAQEITVQYAKDREQFDKPLGAFQAIAHYLSDRQTELDGARTLVHEAAWARSSGQPHRTLAAMARLFAGRMFRDLTATAEQIHGGVGFTVEFDVQLYFRRAKAWQLVWWGDRHLEEIIATDVLDS